MAHRFTVIFENEAKGGYHVFCRSAVDAARKAKPSKKVF